MFKNLYIYSLPKDFEPSSIASNVKEKPLRTVGPMELGTIGFVSPYDDLADGPEISGTEGFVMLRIGIAEKVIPSAVVKRTVEERLRKIREDTGRKVIGARERKRIKEDCLADILPNALVRHSFVNAFVDSVESRFVVDTASEKTADMVVSLLRSALGSFAVVPPMPNESPRVVMTDWLAGGRESCFVTFGNECELRDPIERGAVVRCTRQDLETDEVREHLAAGKQVFAVSMIYGDRMSFTVTSDLAIRKLEFLEGFHDKVAMECEGVEDEHAVHDANDLLMVGEIRTLLRWLNNTFGISNP